MSNSAESQLSSIIPFALLGGIPGSKDIAPSVVFLVAFAIMTPIILYKLIVPRFRSMRYLRVLLFTLSRVGAYLVRIIIAVKVKDGHVPSQGLFIAEAVLMMAGFAPVIEPVVRIGLVFLKSTIHQTLYGHIARLASLACLAAMILLIYVAANVADYNDNPTQNNAIRHAGYIILVVLPVATLIAILGFGQQTVRMGHVPAKGLYLAIALTIFVLIVAIYRLIQSFSKNGQTINEIVVFYIVCCVPEVLAGIVFCVANVKVLYEYADEPDSTSFYPTDGAPLRQKQENYAMA